MNHLVTTKTKPENSNRVPRSHTSVHRTRGACSISTLSGKYKLIACKKIEHIIAMMANGLKEFTKNKKT